MSFEDVATLAGDPVVAEAKKRFKMCSEWESTARVRFLDDIRFENGDSDNGYQWPNDIKRARGVDNRPCLTMNIIRQHNLQISNDARKNKSSIGVIATGGGGTQDAADVFRDVIRHIENRSTAQSIFTTARKFQIGGGIGYWGFYTDYVSDDTFDQELLLRPFNDPLKVFLDPDIEMSDGSDARFGFVFDDVPKEKFKSDYPQYAKKLVGDSPLGSGTSADDWITKDHIRVCEYYRKVSTNDVLYSFLASGERKFVRASKLPENVRDALDADPLTRTRPVRVPEIEWFLIAGETRVDETVWLGKYIPIVRVIGEETVIDGVLDRKGHTRGMKDSQRMYNYNAASQVEFVGLQGRTPWIAPVAAIEEYESMWNTANTTNHSVLIYNHLDDSGNEIPPPQRTSPPTVSLAYQEGMNTAFNQMMMVSGQWQNSMGMAGQERTGKAIGLRQAQSETAVFHFQDHYEDALRYSAKIIIDVVPKLYDTKRVISIMADDGSVVEVTLDPKAKQAFAEQEALDAERARVIFNPNVGTYEVTPSVGPSYDSKREETIDALTLLVTQSKELTPIVGDLLVGAMNFPKAQEAARRLRRMVPPQAVGEGPSQQELALSDKVQKLSAALAESLQNQGKTQLKLVGKEQAREIEDYDAKTRRMSALADALGLEPEGLREIVAQMVHDVLGENGEADGDLDMPEGAEQAPDGNWYLPDPERPGKYLQVLPDEPVEEGALGVAALA